MENRIVFVSHCLLNKTAASDVKFENVKDFIGMLVENNIGIVQLPCPLEFNGFSAHMDKKNCDTQRYREYCRQIACNILNRAIRLRAKNCNVLGIIGVESSPHCGVHRVKNGGKRALYGKGILIEEFEKEMQARRMQIPLLGANTENLIGTMQRVGALLQNC